MMADALTERINNCRDDCEELTKRVDAVEELHAETSDRVAALEYWRNGNGARGAEVRIQDLEKNMSTVLTTVPGLITSEEADKIAKSAVHHIVEQARSKDRTWVSKTRAVALVMIPIASVICALIALLKK